MEKQITLAKSRNEYVKVRINDILYLKVEDNYTTVIIDEEEITTCKSLTEILEKIDNEYFVKISRNIAVNGKKIKSIQLGKNCSVTLVNNEILKPSNRCKRILKEKCLSNKI